MMPSNHLILCHPLLLLPSIFPSNSVFFIASALFIRWPKYWSYSISYSNEYSGLISFRIDCFDLIAVQGILKSLLQHHSSEAPILWLSVFFMVQLSHPYRTTGKTSLTRRTFISKLISLLFNTLCRADKESVAKHSMPSEDVFGGVSSGHCGIVGKSAKHS